MGDMPRREWLCRTGLALGSGLLAMGRGAADPPPKRPNILLIIADDWSWPHAGAYGDPVVQTPAFDRIAREGVLFTNAFCASPSCTPSRGTLLTGQAVHRLAEGANLWSELPSRLAVYPDLLEARGYAVGHSRKGWGPGNDKGGGRMRNPAGPRFADCAAFFETVEEGQPFCFWFGSQDPHRPYDAGSGRRAGMEPASVRVPPFLPDTPEVRDDILDYYAEVQRLDADAGKLLELLEAKGLLDDTLVVATSDNGMPFPRSKANLYESGIHMPLAMRWPRAFAGGRRVDAFVSLCDLAPTFLDAAGVRPPGEMTGRSLLPLARGETQPGRDRVFVERERHANVRRGNLSYPCRAVRTAEFLYIRNLRPDRWPAGDPEVYWSVGPYGDVDGSPTKDFLIERRDDPVLGPYFARAFAKRPAEELYDLAADPGQHRNIADLPEYAEAKARLRAELDAWMRDTADPRATADDDWWDTVGFYGSPAKELPEERRREGGADPVIKRPDAGRQNNGTPGGG